MSYERIPPDVIENILKHHDIVDVVGKYVHLSKNGRNYKGLCPFHSEKTPSFTVNPDKQIFRCFGCQKGGTAISFIQEMEGYTFVEALRSMAEEANIAFQWDLVSTELPEKQRYKRMMLEGYDLAAKLYHYLLKNTQQGKAAMAYLKERNFTDKMIDQFTIGYAPPSWDTLTQFFTKRELELPLMEQAGLIVSRKDNSGYVDLFRDRIMFPIWDDRGKVVAFGGRILGEGQPKYLNTPETPLFNKRRRLYNFHQARAVIRRNHQVVLFEGYVDVIKAWDSGVHSAIATLGTSLTDDHAAVIRRNADQVILCYDGDDAGQSATYKSIDLLQQAGCDVKVAMLPSAMDPDEYINKYGAERFLQFIKQDTMASTKFKLVYLRRNYRMQDEQDRLRYIRKALQMIANLTSPTEREHYLHDLAAEFQYSMDTLKQEMYQFRQDFQKKRDYRDNNENPWNNVMNETIVKTKTPTLLPAYHNAERMLLSIMIGDAQVAQYVQDTLGDSFNVEAYAALAAYLYAYYAEGHEPNASKFISMLDDTNLQDTASSLTMMDSNMDVTQQVLDDYIREIRKYPLQAVIAQKKEEVVRAERSGDAIKAAQIASEIITLDRQLKSM